MTTFLIRSNQAAPDVEIPSLGTFVPGAGGTLELTDPAEQQQALAAEDVRALANDGLYPGPPDPSSNSIIINIDGSDVDPTELDAISGNAPFTGATALEPGTQGLVPAPAAGQTAGYYLAGDGVWRVLPTSTQLPNLEQAGLPSTLQVPDGFWLFWWDTDDSRMFIVRNRAGQLLLVELTQQP